MVTPCQSGNPLQRGCFGRSLKSRVSVRVARGKTIVAAPGPVDEGNEFVIAETLDMAVHPSFDP